MRFTFNGKAPAHDDLNKGMFEVMAEVCEMEGDFDSAARYYLQAANLAINLGDKDKSDRLFKLYQQNQDDAGLTHQVRTYR